MLFHAFFFLCHAAWHFLAGSERRGMDFLQDELLNFSFAAMVAANAVHLD